MKKRKFDVRPGVCPKCGRRIGYRGSWERCGCGYVDRREPSNFEKFMLWGPRIGGKY